MSDFDDLYSHRWLCRTLSPYFATESVQPPKPDLWPEIIRLSDAWLVSARLAYRLRGCDFVPPDTFDVLNVLSKYATDRNKTMRDEMIAIITALNEIDIQPVIFKGAEWLLGHYSPQSERIMTDLDIWIPSDSDQMRGLKALQEIGYAPSQTWQGFDKSNSHHFPPLHSDDAIARLEVHHSLIRANLTNMMGLGEAQKRLVMTEQEGLTYRRLSAGDGIVVAYLQSGHMAAPNFDTRKVTISKWLDFLDRFHNDGPPQIRNASDIGVLVNDNEIDRQLLTVLHDFFGLPYEGIRDTGYINTWLKKRQSGNLILKGLYNSATLANFSSKRKWGAFFKNLRNRLKGSFLISKL
tara:strand:- start:304 stop:1356 length:1053 start_codon:yes stop_codon:yes gene_type:complete